MKIDDYLFGSITVEGRTYTRDVIVFPDRVSPNWWRREGHCLTVEDIKEVLDYRPDVLIVGTGAVGAMKVPQHTKEELKKCDIELIERNTGQAYRLFNEYIEKGKKTVGAFHLTC